jgi:hypothetical protein
MLLRIGAAPGAKLDWAEARTLHRELELAFSSAREVYVMESVSVGG